MYRNETEKIAKLAINKSLLKEYSNSSNERIVYMDNDSEFQIQIFNPYSYTIGVRFDFNEKSSYNYQLLVIRPGERIWLDRYLDNPSKLLFSTYEVGKSEAVQKAIANNGKVKLRFYKEKEVPVVQTYQYNYGPTILYSKGIDNCAGGYVQTSLSDDTNLNFCNSINYCDASINGSTTLGCADNADNTSITSAASSAIYTSCSSDANYSKATYATTKEYSNDSYQSRGLSSFKSKTMETGRIERGSYSDQSFNYVNTEFESYPFKTEEIQILPTSRKPITSQDLEKKYCYSCGRKLNQKFKFCPFCGAKQ